MHQKRFRRLRLLILLKQCRMPVYIMAAWFSFGAVGYWWWENLPFEEALRNALYLGAPPGTFWELYSFWGQCVLFGIVISVFVLQGLQQYNPKEVCSMLAHEMKDHTIVVGHTHFGQRIVTHLRTEKLPYVVIDKDETAVNELVHAGEPVIVDNARENATLEAGGVDRAAVVVIASNNLETALIVTKKVRDRNPRARIIVRCYLDEFTDILHHLGADEVVSSSKSAFRELADHLKPK